MDNDYRQRLRDAYADRVLDDLADIASRSDSEYTRFHALKMLGQHHGLDHVLHQLMNLSRHAKSDWVRLQIASLVGHHLQLFTPFNEHRNAPPSLITLPEPSKPSHKLPPTVEQAIGTGAPFPDEEPLNQPANPHLLNGSHPQPATTIVAEPYNPWRPFKTNEEANTLTIAAIARALHLTKSTTHPPDP